MRYRLLVVLLALAASSPVFARTLYWRALGVDANLDADGKLHVKETQVMVFDGDWNGGERTFRIGRRQSLQFESLERVENGVAVPMTGGDVDKVDHYKFFPDNVLRWRSRMPDDAPFEHKQITYVLRYTLSGVVRHTGDLYLLAHDFAFPNRGGVIERFSLQFNLDPLWRGAKSPVVIQRANLQPGQSVVVPMRLTFTGAHAPGSVITTMSRTTMTALKLLFVLGLVLLIGEFAMHENAKGRFGPLPTGVDESFLQQHLLNLKPEVAGAAIDNKTGAPEVAAVLARLTQEGKIESNVTGKKLSMTLKTDKSTLPAYEEKLVRGLFFSGNTTDTDKIKKHYKNTGFDPGKIVENGIKPDLQHIKEWKDDPKPRANWRNDWIFFGLAFALAIAAATLGTDDRDIAVSILFLGDVLFGLAAFAAYLNSRALANLPFRFAIPAVFLGTVLWFIYAYIGSSIYYVLHLLTPVSIGLLGLAMAKMVFDLLRSPESAERIAFRNRLYAARNYFVRELRSPQPRIRDAWYPYLLAFGLGSHVDRWFGSHGSKAVQAGSTEPMLHVSSSSSSSTSSAPAFTGGGGAFGGAGATGGWAIAAAAIGAGVATPGSSGSGGGGGGGGGGGSSSGGGGGGGW